MDQGRKGEGVGVDIYHIWCDLRSGVKDTDFTKVLTQFLAQLQEDDKIATFRLTRCKLGLKPDALREFHIMIETHDLAQLDRAFKTLAPREGAIDELHFSTNAMVQNVMFALYRDYPD